MIPVELTYRNRANNLAAQTKTHIYLWPARALGPYVAHYTLCLGSGAPLLEPQALPPLTILPDASGCLVFTRSEEALDGLLFGPSSRAVQVDNDLETGPLRFFIEFRPGGLSAFTHIPLWELTDQILPLPLGEQSLDRMVQSCWRQAADLDDFIQAIDAGLCARLNGDLKFAGLLAQFLAGQGSREPLASANYSPRHLARLFRSKCGLSPKGLERVCRVNAAVGRMGQDHTLSLTRLAQELGYFDQAHFIHDFKAVCGVTPGAYRASLSDFYNEPLKF